MIVEKSSGVLLVGLSFDRESGLVPKLARLERLLCCRFRTFRFWSGNIESGHDRALLGSSAFQDFNL